MPRENKRQKRRGQQGADEQERPRPVRSPALESAELRRNRGRTAHAEVAEAAETPARSGGRKKAGALHAPLRNARVHYAAEGTGLRVAPRKALPPLKRRGIESTPAQSGALTVGWRSNHRARATGPQELPPAISAEEELQLAQLEMSMPRVPGRIDPWLLIVVMALLSLGIVMVYSASSFLAASYTGDAGYYFQRELMWVSLGIIVMLVTMRIDYRYWRRFSLTGMIIILPLLVIVLKFGVTAYGASRWLALGSFFQFQPSELTKLVLALYIADWLARKGNQVSSFLYGLAPFVILVGIVLGLVLLENDMGTAIIIAGIAVAMFFTAGANIAQFLLALVCGGLIFLREALQGYRYYRITGFLDPFKDKTSINLQLYQGLLALGSGYWFGLGLGNSRQKTGYLPFPYTDSIFPIIGEELGFLGCALIVILFLFLAFRGFRLARRTQDLYGALLATGITTWLVLQAFINIGANTATIPYTGVPLPFISFGGSSVVVSLAAVGILLNISRYIQEPEMPALVRYTVNLRKKKA
ncbi:MAG TPA: putative lipid II flippase FtsW [Ktedonobacteraceae bacterium]